MSKMSNVALELDESAAELGFADHLEAMANGYDWAINDYGTAYLFKRKDPQEQAHQAWLEDKEEVLKRLRELMKAQHLYEDDKDDIEMAINFIEMGEI